MSKDARAAFAALHGLSVARAYWEAAGIWRALALGVLYGVLSTPLDTLGAGSSLSVVVWPAPGVAVFESAGY